MIAPFAIKHENAATQGPYAYWKDNPFCVVKFAVLTVFHKCIYKC